MSYNQIPQEVVSGQPGVYCACTCWHATYFFSHFSLFSHTCPKLSIYIACPAAPWVLVSASTTVYLCRMQYHLKNSITSPEVYPENRGFEIWTSDFRAWSITDSPCFSEMTSHYLQQEPSKRQGLQGSSFHKHEHNPDSSAIKCIY